MNRSLYRLLLALLFPWLLFDSWRRWRRAPVGSRRLFMQFGRLPRELPVNGIWLHAVSLGEVRAAVSLIEALKTRWPDLPLCISTTTETGARAARSLGLPHFYAPYDYGWVVRRLLRRLRPKLIVVMETELWPNWVEAAAEQTTPLAIVNARLSDRSYRAYRRFGGSLLRRTLARVPMICAQTDIDRQRFLELMASGDGGAHEGHRRDTYRVIDCGNLKFDAAKPDLQPVTLPAERPVWLAASTHPGEEPLMIEAHAQLRSSCPDALLVLVPRHPERSDDVQAIVEQAGLRVARYSSLGDGDLPNLQADVLLVDQTGVLMPFFAAVQVVFMGGSLVPLGGHNPIEPAVFGRAVLSGPHVRNFRSIFASLQQDDAVQMVDGVAELAAAVQQVWQDPTEWSAKGERAEAVVVRNRGATACTIAELDRLLR